MNTHAETDKIQNTIKQKIVPMRHRTLCPIFFNVHSIEEVRCRSTQECVWGLREAHGGTETHHFS